MDCLVFVRDVQKLVAADKDSNWGYFKLHIALRGSPATRAAAESLTDFKHFVRVWAAWAHNRIPPLVNALVEEGGLLPSPTTERMIAKPQLPVLAPDPFPRPTEDD